MHIPKKYFHDRAVLLLLSVNTFLAFATTTLLVLRINTSADSQLVQYRANLGINDTKGGSATHLYAFIVFAAFVLLFNTMLSMRIYHARRHFSIVVLALATLLLGLGLIVSNALLILPSVLQALLAVIFIVTLLFLMIVERERKR